jgi:hypothetical protein
MPLSYPCSLVQSEEHWKWFNAELLRITITGSKVLKFEICLNAEPFLDNIYKVTQILKCELCFNS